jgi:hypothetical protein
MSDSGSESQFIGVKVAAPLTGTSHFSSASISSAAKCNDANAKLVPKSGFEKKYPVLSDTIEQSSLSPLLLNADSKITGDGSAHREVTPARSDLALNCVTNVDGDATNGIEPASSNRDIPIGSVACLIASKPCSEGNIDDFDANDAVVGCAAVATESLEGVPYVVASSECASHGVDSVSPGGANPVDYAVACTVATVQREVIREGAHICRCSEDFLPLDAAAGKRGLLPSSPRVLSCAVNKKLPPHLITAAAAAAGGSGGCSSGGQLPPAAVVAAPPRGCPPGAPPAFAQQTPAL